MANQIRLKVGGIEYAIESDEDEMYLKSLGAELDRRLDYLAKKSPFLSTTMVAVVAALEAYDTAKKQAAENDRLRLEMKRLLEEAACARLQAEEARRALSQLQSGQEGADAD